MSDASERFDPAAGAEVAPDRGSRGTAARQGETLRDCVARNMQTYFEDLDGVDPRDLYAFVLDEVEAPLLEAVMAQTGGNQSRAAQVLGLSRGTLRKKLAHHGLL